VMEYLRGHDLWSVVSALQRRGEVMPLGIALAIVMGICAGLHHAHELVDDDGRSRQIVHRDVSPRNVVLTFDGDVKIVDFGIAKATHRRTETHATELKGKLRYMAPEQCRREPVDRRADVFAVAAILWELTVGRRLFEGKTDDEVIEALSVGEIRAPSQVVPDYPIELERIVMHGLAFDPEPRWPTTEAMRLALAEFAFAHDVRLTTVKLGDFLRSLFGDERETMPPSRPDRSPPREASRSNPLPALARDSHSIETMVSSTERRRRRSQVWMLLGAAGALMAVLAGRHRPHAALRPGTAVRAPTARTSPAAATTKPSSPPSSPSPAAPPSPSPSRSPVRETHRHHHHGPARAARKPLSENLDALME